MTSCRAGSVTCRLEASEHMCFCLWGGGGSHGICKNGCSRHYCFEMWGDSLPQGSMTKAPQVSGKPVVTKKWENFTVARLSHCAELQVLGIPAAFEAKWNRKPRVEHDLSGGSSGSV